LRQIEQKSVAELIELWGKFGRVSVDGNGVLTEPFLHFSVGTRQQAVWQWFEEMNPCFIVGDTLHDKSMSLIASLH
jgi:hypothetical protein